eukprot:CFRG0257T1
MVQVAISRNIIQNVDPSSTYELIEQIGDGSFGEVFKGTLKKNNKTVAVKIVAIQDDDELLEFQVEIDILTKCNHKNVIKMEAAYLWKHTLYMVLEYCGGGSIDDIYEQLEAPLDEPQIRECCFQVLQGLQYMHENKMVHRDIKAGNVLLTNSGEVKLADFGVSAMNIKTNQARDTFIGTPYWMAPEVIACETSKEDPYNDRCDIWSLGITAIEFAQMNPPYHDLHPMRVLFRIPKSLPPRLSEPENWSHNFNNFIEQCLTKDAHHRPSAKELLKHPFFSEDQYTPLQNDVHPEMMRLLEERASVEESMMEGDMSNEEDLSVQEEVSDDDGRMADRASRMSVVEHDVAEKPFLVPTVSTADSKMTVVKTRTIRNKDGTTRRVTTMKKKSELEETRSVRRMKRDQMNMVKEISRKEQHESRLRKIGFDRQMESLARDQAAALAVIRKRHSDHIEAMQRIADKDMGKHEKNIPNMIMAKEMALKKIRDKDLMAESTTFDTAAKYDLREMKKNAKKEGWSKSETKANIEAFERKRDLEKHEQLSEWKRQRDSQNRQELMDMELQLLDTQYQSDYNSTVQIHHAHTQFLKIGDQNLWSEQLNKRLDLEKHIQEQEKDAITKQVVLRHSKQLGMQNSINKERNSELDRLISAMNKQMPKDIKIQYNAAFREFLRDETALKNAMKADHRKERDASDLPKATRKQLRKQHEDDERKALMEYKERFMNSQEKLRKRHMADVKEKIQLMRDESAKANANDMRDITEIHQLQMENILAAHKKEDKAIRIRHEQALADFKFVQQKRADTLAEQQAREIAKLEAKYNNLSHVVREKWLRKGNDSSSSSLLVGASPRSSTHTARSNSSLSSHNTSYNVSLRPPAY